MEHRIETLWEVLEETQSIMYELSIYFMEQMGVQSQKAVMQESKELEVECEKIIEGVQSVIVIWAAESSVVSPPIEQNTTSLVDNYTLSLQITKEAQQLLSQGLVSTLSYPMI